MEQPTGTCDRCWSRQMQCSMKASTSSCMQCKRSKVRCVFGSTGYSPPESTPKSHPTVPHPNSNRQSEAMNVSQWDNSTNYVPPESTTNSTNYLSPESTANSYPTVPCLDPGIAYRSLGENGTQQPIKPGAWDWVGYGIVDVSCSRNWLFHMTSHSFQHDERLCGLMAAKVNFLVQQASHLPAPHESWDWIAEGTALEVSRSKACSPDWDFHIQDSAGHNSLLCGWMAKKLKSLV